MHQSKIAPSRLNKKSTLARIEGHILKHPKAYCGSLKRHVFLKKFLPATLNRPKEVMKRIPYFFVALDIIKKSKQFEYKELKGSKCFCFVGKDTENNKIVIHLREDVENNDRKLYLISCFPKK